MTSYSLECHSPGKGRYYYAIAIEVQARSLLLIFDNRDTDKKFAVCLVMITRENVLFNRGIIITDNIIMIALNIT